jgi:hypothetical protein
VNKRKLTRTIRSSFLGWPFRKKRWILSREIGSPSGNGLFEVDSEVKAANLSYALKLLFLE